MLTVNDVSRSCRVARNNHAEKITNRSQSRASRAEITRLLRQRTIHNNGVVPQQAAAALRLLIAAAAIPVPPDGGTLAAV
jgi:hypothetical protein